MSLAKGSVAAPSQSFQGVSGIRLAPQFVNRLCTRLEIAHSMPDGVSGLLFGTAHDNLVVVQAYRSLADADVAAIESGQLRLDDAVTALAKAAETDPALAALDVVGWYAFRPLGGLHEADIAFHNRLFPAMSDVALVVRRADAGQLLFEFYTRARHGLLTENEHRWGASHLSPRQTVSGPVDIALLKRPEEQPIEATLAPEPKRSHLFSVLHREESKEHADTKRRLITTGNLASVPAVVAPPKRSGVPWFSSAILFAVAAGGTFAVLVLHGVPSSSSGSFWRAILPDTGLNLRIEGQGDRVMLSWNRRNSVVHSATGGLLHIDDGTQHRDVRLDAAQIENGAVLYRPNSDDVSFRLQVQGQDGRTVAENLRILDSSRTSQPLDLSASSQTAGTPTAITAAPVQAPHVWQPVVASSTVTVPQPPEPTLEPPKSATQSAQKFDLSRLNAPAIPPPTSPVTGNSDTTTRGSAPAVASTETGPTPVQTDRRSEQLAPATSPQSALPEQLPPSAEPAGQIPATPFSASAKPTLPATNAPTFAQRYTPPRPIKQALPNISQLPASIIASTPEIDVIVTVNSSGRVTQARVQPHGRKPARAMVAAAVDAAKDWFFEPAKLDGKAVASEHTIVFQFGH